MSVGSVAGNVAHASYWDSFAKSASGTGVNGTPVGVEGTCFKAAAQSVGDEAPGGLSEHMRKPASSQEVSAGCPWQLAGGAPQRRWEVEQVASAQTRAHTKPPVQS